MKFFKLKYLILLVFLIISGVFSFGFISNKILKDKIINFFEKSDNFKNYIKFEDIKYKFFNLNKEINIYNVSIDLNQQNKNLIPEDNREFFRQIFIPIIKIKLSFFDIIGLFFSKKINIKNFILIDPNINFFLSNDNDILKLLNQFDGKKISIKIVNGYIKLQNANNLSNQVFEKVDGSIDYNGKFFFDIKTNFSNHNNIYDSLVQIENRGSKQNSQAEIIDSYDLKFLIKNNENSVEYKAKFDFNDKNKEFEFLDGEIFGSGKNLLELSKIFCEKCFQNNCYLNKDESKKIKSKNLNFIFNAKTKINKDNKNFLKIEDIKFNIENKENEIIGMILYDFLKKKFYTNFLVEKFKFNLLDIPEYNSYDDLVFLVEKIKNFIGSEFFFIKFYLDFLKRNNSENKIIVNQMNFNDQIEIQNLSSEFSSEKGFFEIKNFNANLNKIFNLKIINNTQKNSEELQNLNIFITKNNNDFLNFKGKFFESNLVIENFKFIDLPYEENEDLKTQISGNFELKFHSKSNFFLGNIKIDNFDLQNYLLKWRKNKIFDKIFENFNKKNNKITGGDFIKKILFLVQKYNLFYDLNVNFKSFKNFDQKFENLEIKTLIKDNKIVSNISGENSLVKKFQIDSLIMFKNYIPYLQSEVFLTKISIDEIGSKFFKNSIFLDEKEFKKNDSQNIWRNFEFNFNAFKDIDMIVNLNVNDFKINNQDVKKFSSKIQSKNNILNIEDIYFKIDDNSDLSISANINLEKMLFSGSFELNNINYRKFFLEKDIKDDFLIFDLDLIAIGKFSSVGEDFQSFIQNFNANIKYSGSNLILNKISIDGFINKFDEAKNQNKIISLSEQSVVFGQTQVDNVKGDISIRNNVVENNFEISNKNFNGVGAFNMFLQNCVFKSLIRIVFLSRLNQEILNFVDLKISGNFFKINKNIDIESIREEKI